MKASRKDTLKKQIVGISQRCGLNSWCPGTLGNISVLDSNKIHIKRTGADLNRLKLKEILTLDLEGNVLEGEGKPSIETSFHLEIYKTRKDVKAVYHVHPPFATAYAIAGKKIPMVTEAAKIVLVDVPLLAHAPPGSTQLATLIADAFGDPNVKAVLLREHGVVSIGETLENAYQITALVEDTAKLALLSSLIRS